MISRKKLASVRFGGRATISGDDDGVQQKKEIEQVHKLLQGTGYNTHFMPCEVGPWEVSIYPNKDVPIRLTDIKKVRKFLRGGHIERSMWTMA